MADNIGHTEKMGSLQKIFLSEAGEKFFLGAMKGSDSGETYKLVDKLTKAIQLSDGTVHAHNAIVALWYLALSVAASCTSINIKHIGGEVDEAERN
jgi:hypothetical protein